MGRITKQQLANEIEAAQSAVPGLGVRFDSDDVAGRNLRYQLVVDHEPCGLFLTPAELISALATVVAVAERLESQAQSAPCVVVVEGGVVQNAAGAPYLVIDWDAFVSGDAHYIRPLLRSLARLAGEVSALATAKRIDVDDARAEVDRLWGRVQQKYGDATSLWVPDEK